MYDTNNLTEEQIENFKASFILLDKDGKGFLTTEEFGTVIRSLGRDLTDAELQDLFKKVDEDGSGTLDFSEFLGLAAWMMTTVEQADEVLEAFKIFDRDGNGLISAVELKDTATKFDGQQTDAEIAEQFGKMDVDGYGQINYNEFAQS